MLKKYSLILLPFLIVFSYLSIFSNNNSTIEPTYLVYDRDCNEFGPFELTEYESMIGDGSKYLGYCILDVYATSTTVWFQSDEIFDNKLSIEISSCDLKINNLKEDKNDIKDTFYIVGHAYGSTSADNSGLTPGLINYFEGIEETKNQNIILSGDFVRSNDIDAFIEVKNYLNYKFSQYFLAVGNHELQSPNGDNLGPENYLEIFKNEIFHIQYENLLVISANFSTSNWEPREELKNQINDLVNAFSGRYVILVSHQLFWAKEAENIKPNSYALLEEELNVDSLHWINKSKEKIYIVISGDYGNRVSHKQQTYCKAKNNRLFIANGLKGNPEFDKILILDVFDNHFEITEISLKES